MLLTLTRKVLSSSHCVSFCTLRFFDLLEVGDVSLIVGDCHFVEVYNRCRLEMKKSRKGERSFKQHFARGLLSVPLSGESTCTGHTNGKWTTRGPDQSPCTLTRPVVYRVLKDCF